MDPREQIVQSIVELLKAANTAAGSRVTSTVDPHKRTQLPAVSVYGRSDQVNEAESSEMEEGHDAEIEIVGSADPSAINDLMAQVGDIVRADPYFGGLASDSNITRTPIDVATRDGHGDPLVAMAVLTVSALYHIALVPT